MKRETPDGDIVGSEPRWHIKPFNLGLALLALSAVLFLLWQLSDALILLFAAIMVAAALHRTAALVERLTPLNGFWSKLVSWLLLAAALAGFLVLMGSRIWSEFVNLQRELPGLLRRLGEFFGIENLSDTILDQLWEFFGASGFVGDLAGATGAFMGGLGATIVAIFGGVFLAADPKLYRDGISKLFPAPWNLRVVRALDDAAQALSEWLFGKMLSMVVIGVVTTVC